MTEGDPQPRRTAGASGSSDAPPGRTAVVYGGAAIGAVLVALSGAILVSVPVGVLGGVVFVFAALLQARRIIGRPRPRGPRR